MYYYFWNKHFQINREASWANEIISDFDFFEEILEGHQENLQRKFKRVSISKCHLFRKTLLKLSLQKCYTNFTANVARFLKRILLFVE